MSNRILRKHASAIFKTALAAADPVDAVVRHLKRIDFSQFHNIYVVGAGKAGASMAQAAERVLGRRITAGLVNVKYGYTAKMRRIELNECGHPVPDARGEAGAERIAGIAGAAQEDDLLVCLISGGASALMPLPAPPVTLAQKQETTKLLLDTGANIHEMNAVRKHMSRIKGGQLARMAAPARVETLLLSDVVGDNLDTIGSGPTAPDASSLADAKAILGRYGIPDRLPGIETPKPGDPISAACAIPLLVATGWHSTLPRDARASSVTGRSCCRARSKARPARSPACTPPSRAKLRRPAGR